MESSHMLRTRWISNHIIIMPFKLATLMLRPLCFSFVFETVSVSSLYKTDYLCMFFVPHTYDVP
jgi:hypothetical protein